MILQQPLLTCESQFISTVESSLFVGDQYMYLWISWVTLTHEFESPKTCMYFFFALPKQYPNHIIYQSPMKLRPHETEKFWLPKKIDPHELK
jgi:hypothetical protein